MMARTFVERFVAPTQTRKGSDGFSGASAIVLIDLRKEDAEASAKELVDWFGELVEPSR